MKGDFSKWKTNGSEFTGVLHQQGRVLLDSDWNDHALIVVEWQDQLVRDITGSNVVAVPSHNPEALKVLNVDVLKDKVMISMTPGKAWVDGVHVNLSENTRGMRNVTCALPTSTPRHGSRYAVILEVWRESINGFQMPDELIEPALGGPDTTERISTFTAPKLLELSKDETCQSLAQRIHELGVPSKGRLRVTAGPEENQCDLPEIAGYTGLEHALYRIEIADVDSENEKPQFKWSRCNGGLVGRGTKEAEGKIRITFNKDAIKSSGLSEFYLEIVQYDQDLGYWRPVYGSKAKTIDGGYVLECTSPPMLGQDIPQPDRCEDSSFFFRLWNGIDKIENFTGSPRELDQGIFLEFDATDPNKYLPADYWVFRATPSQKPGVLVDMEPPHGVKYRRAPLAILTLRKGKNTRRANKILDCRRIFNPLTKPSQPISDRIFRVRVRVDGRLWKEVPSLSTREPDDKVYEVITDAVGRTYVQFGDGVHGQRLPSGTGRITASYRNRSGDTGRVSIKLGKETDPDQIRLMLLPEVSLERS